MGRAGPESITVQHAADRFGWLEHEDLPATAAWLDEQRRLWAAHSPQWTSIAAFTRWLDVFTSFDEFSAPLARGSRTFFTLREGSIVRLLVDDGRAQRVLLQTGGPDAPTGDLIEDWVPSPAGTRLAVQRWSGDDMLRLLVLDVDSGQETRPPVPLDRLASVAWVSEDRLYLTGRPPGADEDGGDAVLAVPATSDEPAELVLDAVLGDTTEMELSGSADGRWVVAVCTSGLSARGQTWVCDTRHTAWRQLPLLDDGLSTVHFGSGDLLYVLTDAQAPRGDIRTVRLSTAQVQTTLVPQDDCRVLAGFAVLDGVDPVLLAVWEDGGRSALTRHDARTGQLAAEVPLPGPGLITELTSRSTPPAAWLSYCDPLTPPGIHLYRPDTDRLDEWQPSRRVTDPPLVLEWLTYRAPDGTEIPMTVVRPAGLAAEAPVPTVLQAYGAFGHTELGHYYAAALSWAAEGGVFAFAGVRGGGEYGEAWHKSGMREHKQRGIDDLLAAASFLVTSGRTTSEQLALMGESAGGLLVAAALTQQPDVAIAVACIAPLTDMARYEYFGLGGLWVDEFGTAEDPTELSWLLRYSPYQHVRAGTAYPATLFVVEADDERVDPAHARKMCAALQDASSSGAPILLRVHATGGHGQRVREQRLLRYGEALGFLAHRTGLNRPVRNKPEGALGRS
ncbi:MAG TPA: prolyl oligopeptidase family serine peptidase [Mycobacteriales bacterium]|nr:prolyl oligopeptidase family serine peptidase [Mycobacteriales bacterium]